MSKSKGIFYAIESWADKKWKEIDQKQPPEPFKSSPSNKKVDWNKFFSQIQVSKLKSKKD